ncbi:AroM family protein [Kordiimonas lipolytica]|uniref:AroM family protein n=1 Tax=Kordiimonas lipolytica TaxID=1662421 RepID=A0ABV8UFP5_9PROT|nr:AroM family protein [Kordiimonas lipolytica]
MITIWTIGQGTRKDLLLEWQSLLPKHVQVEVRGALDGLVGTDIAAQAPEVGDTPLFTVLANGKHVIVGHQKITKRLHALLKEPTQSKQTINVLACTSDFPVLYKTGLIMPSRVVPGLIRSVTEGKRVGVFVPLLEQVPVCENSWRMAGLNKLNVLPLRPDSDSQAISTAVAEMAKFEPDIIVCDCFSFGSDVKNLIASELNCSVVLPVTLMARIVGELI